MQQNSTFTDKHLASLAAIMLLAPAVNFMLKGKDIDIVEDEEGFVKSYVRYGYYILMVLALGLIVWGIYSFFFPISILYWVNYGLLGVVILMIVVGVFSIINNKTIIDGEIQNTNHAANPALLIYFIPLYNFYMWYNEGLDEHNYWWVKESVLWWSLYMIAISIWPIAGVIFVGLFLIIARCIMVTVGMDLLSLNTKNTINKWFYHNVEEFIAYPLGIIMHSLKKLFQKTSTLHGEIESWKLTYAHTDSLANWRSIISYLLVVAAIGYRAYNTWIMSDPTVGVSLALLPQILLLGKILMTIPSGKMPRVPIVYSLLGGRKERNTPVIQGTTSTAKTDTTPTQTTTTATNTTATPPHI